MLINLEQCIQSLIMSHGSIRYRHHNIDLQGVKVKCVTTGEVFDSIRLAAREKNVPESTIRWHLKCPDRFHHAGVDRFGRELIWEKCSG